MQLKLKEPIQFGSATLTELVFREKLVAGDLRGLRPGSMNDLTFDDFLKVASRMSGQPEAALYGLSLEDLTAVLGVVADFFKASAGQKTLTTLSASLP